MTSKSHGTFQIILTILSGINVANISGYISILPPKWSALIIVLATCAQGLAGWINHYYSPDGNKIENIVNPK